MISIIVNVNVMFAPMSLFC